jgi:hypothetical protein
MLNSCTELCFVLYGSCDQPVFHRSPYCDIEKVRLLGRFVIEILNVTFKSLMAESDILFCLDLTKFNMDFTLCYSFKFSVF